MERTRCRLDFQRGERYGRLELYSFKRFYAMVCGSVANPTKRRCVTVENRIRVRGEGACSIDGCGKQISAWMAAQLR
jgi:hypothetical protein